MPTIVEVFVQYRLCTIINYDKHISIRGRGGISVRRYFRDFFLYKRQFHALVFHRMKSSSG